MRRFSRRFVVAALAVVGGYFAARMLATRTTHSAAPASGSSAAVTPGASASAGAWEDGNALVDRVLATVDRRPNIAARFRQLLRIGEQPMSGAGEYWQQGIGNTRRTCWRWTTLVSGETAAFRQVLDKDAHLWTDVRLPGERTVTRVDVGHVRRELSLAGDAPGQGGAGGDRQQLELLARGGLSQLVAELQRSFAFAPATDAAIEGGDALAIVGRWRPDALARDWPGLDAVAASNWPAHLPHHVVVVVGARDFFPYVVEYRRGADAALADAPPNELAADPLARYEFFEVNYAATMAKELFEFPSTDVDWRDQTGAVIERLRPAPPAPLTAQRPGTWRQ